MMSAILLQRLLKERVIAGTPNLLPQIRSIFPPYGYTTIFVAIKFSAIAGGLVGFASVIFLTRCRTLLTLWLAVVLLGQLVEVILSHSE